MTDYEKHVERRARAIALEKDCNDGGRLCAVPLCLCKRQARATFAADREAGYLTVKWPPDYDAIWDSIQKNAPDTAKRRLSIHDFYQVIGRVVAAIAAGAVEEE